MLETLSSSSLALFQVPATHSQLRFSLLNEQRRQKAAQTSIEPPRPAEGRRFEQRSPVPSLLKPTDAPVGRGVNVQRAVHLEAAKVQECVLERGGEAHAG